MRQIVASVSLFETCAHDIFFPVNIFVLITNGLSVLSNKKETVENKNRKDYATEKWEQEVRDSLTKRKATNSEANLSKQDKALVAAQLVTETEIRSRIATVQARLKRGVELVASLVASNAERMQRHTGLLARSLLDSAFGPGSFLLDGRAFEVFLVSDTTVLERR